MKPSTDYAAIKKIFLDESVHKWIIDDYTPETIIIHESLTYLLSEDKDGVIVLVPRNGIEIEVHTAIMKSARHKALHYAAKTLDWIFENTQCLKVTTSVPFFNTRAYKFTLKLGFRDEGVNRMSFMKDGQVHDQWLLGITKEEWLCQY